MDCARQCQILVPSRKLAGLSECVFVIAKAGFGLPPETLRVPVPRRKPPDYVSVLKTRRRTDWRDSGLAAAGVMKMAPVDLRFLCG